MKTLALFLILIALPASGVDLLIKAVDATNTISAVKDMRGCYKRGDIVAIGTTGQFNGTEEVKPPAHGGVFVQIRICKNDGSELTPSALEGIIRSKWTNIVSIVSPQLTNGTEIVRRRLLRVTLDMFTIAQKNTLNTVGHLGFTNDGQAQITLSVARNRIENKLTGETP